jgi:hypothetical protein
MVPHTAQLTVQVDAGPDADADEINELTLLLRRELLELDLESVDLARRGTAPPGARAVGVLSIGTIIVTLAQAPELLRAVVDLVQSWLGGSGRRSVKLALDGDILEVSGLSPRDQRELIASWIARHGSGRGAR